MEQNKYEREWFVLFMPFWNVNCECFEKWFHFNCEQKRRFHTIFHGFIPVSYNFVYFKENLKGFEPSTKTLGKWHLPVIYVLDFDFTSVSVHKMALSEIT